MWHLLLHLIFCLGILHIEEISRAAVISESGFSGRLTKSPTKIPNTLDANAHFLYNKFQMTIIQERNHHGKKHDRLRPLRGIRGRPENDGRDEIRKPQVSGCKYQDAQKAELLRIGCPQPPENLPPAGKGRPLYHL